MTAFALSKSIAAIAVQADDRTDATESLRRNVPMQTFRPMVSLSSCQ
jgi:hypothetical protein